MGNFWQSDGGEGGIQEGKELSGIVSSSPISAISYKAVKLCKSLEINCNSERTPRPTMKLVSLESECD